MPNYDVMIEYRAELSGSDDNDMIDKALDEMAHRLRRFSAVIALHGQVLSVEGEVEASGPSGALAMLEMAFDQEADRAGMIDIVGDSTSFWVTDTARAKAQVVLLKDKTA